VQDAIVLGAGCSDLRPDVSGCLVDIIKPQGRFQESAFLALLAVVLEFAFRDPFGNGSFGNPDDLGRFTKGDPVVIVFIIL